MLRLFKSRNVLTNYFIFLFSTLIVSFAFYNYDFKFQLIDYHIEVREYLSFAINFIITTFIFGVLITSRKKKYRPDDFSFIHLLKQIYEAKLGESLLAIAMTFIMAPIIIMTMMWVYWLAAIITIVTMYLIIFLFYIEGFLFVVFSISLILNIFYFSAMFVDEVLTPEEEIYTKKELNE